MRKQTLAVSPPDELIQLAKAVLALPRCPEIAEDQHRAREVLWGCNAPDFSSRQHRLLLCLCSGMSNKQIAEELGKAESTVKNDLTKLFSAIGVPDRLNAVLWARHHGYTLGEPEG